jgi:DNA adenine methylase
MNEDKIAKPFVKWAGGKTQLLTKISNYFPSRVNYNKFIEPFVGGGAVFFYLQPDKAVINDLNKELMDTYREIKKNVDELIEWLENFQDQHSKNFYYEIRDRYNNENIERTEKAAIFIYLNKTCYNGLYRVNKSGKFNVPTGNKNKFTFNEENLRNISNLLKKTSIKDGTFEKIVNYAEKNDFVYLDPPYFPLSKTSNFTSYTSDSFLEEEQIKLAEVFKELDKKGCKIVLSNSNVKFIRNLYKDYNIHKVYARRMINCISEKRGEITELVITNFN